MGEGKLSLSLSFLWMSLPPGCKHSFREHQAPGTLLKLCLQSQGKTRVEALFYLCVPVNEGKLRFFTWGGGI